MLIVDTSSWIAYFRGAPSPLVDDALSLGRVYLPPVVAAELVSGKLSHKQRLQLTDFLTDLPLCRCDLEHWRRVGLFRSALASYGVSISTPDAHVAQCALDLDGQLLSSDRIFGQVAKHSALVWHQSG